MVASHTPIEMRPLRHWLKEGTADLHDRLDASTDAAALGSDSVFVTFLIAQYRARQPIETWADQYLDASLQPPPVADLIAEDLRELGAPVPTTRPFELPTAADPIGVAWAIGGSSLGNKALLFERRRMGAHHAERFLADTRGMLFFRSLLPRLALTASEAEAAGAICAAEAVFQIFLDAVATPMKAAA